MGPCCKLDVSCSLCLSVCLSLMPHFIRSRLTLRSDLCMSSTWSHSYRVDPLTKCTQTSHCSCILYVELLMFGFIIPVY
jgi:hypothetical protein